MVLLSLGSSLEGRGALGCSSCLGLHSPPEPPSLPCSPGFLLPLQAGLLWSPRPRHNKTWPLTPFLRTLLGRHCGKQQVQAPHGEEAAGLRTCLRGCRQSPRPSGPRFLRVGWLTAAPHSVLLKWKHQWAVNKPPAAPWVTEFRGATVSDGARPLGTLGSPWEAGTGKLLGCSGPTAFHNRESRRAFQRGLYRGAQSLISSPAPNTAWCALVLRKWAEGGVSSLGRSTPRGFPGGPGLGPMAPFHSPTVPLNTVA